MYHITGSDISGETFTFTGTDLADISAQVVQSGADLGRCPVTDDNDSPCGYVNGPTWSWV